LLVALSIVVIAYLPSGARSRLGTLACISSDYNVTEPEQRIDIWRNAWILFAKRPWGVGVDAFEAAEGSITGGRYRAAHNMYLQILCELGLVGAALYFRNWRLTWRAVSAVSADSIAGQHADIDRDLISDLHMIKASIVGILIAGFFLSQAYSLLVYVIFAMAASLTNSERPKPAPMTSLYCSREDMAAELTNHYTHTW
jgi:O-antigen ligase